MGSYCGIHFDDLDVCVAKSFVPDHFCALFQESDRVVRRPSDPGADDTARDELYETSRAVMLERLALLGCTRKVVHEAFEIWRQEEIASIEDGDLDEHDKQFIAALTSLSFEEWQSRVSHVLRTQYSHSKPADEIDRRMRELDSSDSWLWFDGYGTHLNIRALLDACTDVANVSLDLSDLIGSGYLAKDVALCADRRTNDPFGLRPLAPTVILAEGSSDIRILHRSLATLFPEKQDYFSFFNHSELKVDGGAPYLWRATIILTGQRQLS